MKNDNLKTILITLLAFIVGIVISIQFIKPKVIKVPDVKYIKGDTVFVKKDSLIYVNKKTTVFIKDSLKKVSSVDTVFYSGNDTIGLNATVEIDTIAQWFIKLEHKDYQLQRTDTVKITEFKEVVTKENRKFYEEPYFNFLAGVIITIIIITGAD